MMEIKKSPFGKYHIISIASKNFQQMLKLVGQNMIRKEIFGLKIRPQKILIIKEKDFTVDKPGRLYNEQKLKGNIMNNKTY